MSFGSGFLHLQGNPLGWYQKPPSAQKYVGSPIIASIIHRLATVTFPHSIHQSAAGYLAL